jgi:predicted Zn-dependent protease
MLSMVGAVVSTATLGAASGIGQLFHIAGKGAIASYSRSQERQADEIGQDLAAETGWDPAALSSFLETLEVESQREGESTQLASFFSSHPLTSERIDATTRHAAQLSVTPEPPIAAGRGAFLAKLDGLLVGPDPAHGVFHGQRFLHPDLAMTIDFPPGWETLNSEQTVAAISPDEDALIALQLQEEGNDTKAAALRFSEGRNVELREGRSLTIGGRPAYHAVAVAQTRDGPLGLDLCWIAHRDMIFRFTGMSPADRFSRHERALTGVGRSFAPLSESERASIHEMRLKIARANGAESLAALSRRVGNVMPLEQTAIVNGLSQSAVPAAGTPVKVAVKMRYSR